ncbi:hypothetical protein Tco_0775014 [Tanacetum coccineum]
MLSSCSSTFEHHHRLAPPKPLATMHQPNHSATHQYHRTTNNTPLVQFHDTNYYLSLRNINNGIHFVPEGSKTYGAHWFMVDVTAEGEPKDVQRKGAKTMVSELQAQWGEIFSTSSPPMVELYAIRGACRLVVTYGWQNVVVESDSKVAISFACAQVDPHWSLSAICSGHQSVGISIWYLLFMG